MRKAAILLGVAVGVLWITPNVSADFADSRAVVAEARAVCVVCGGRSIRLAACPPHVPSCRPPHIPPTLAGCWPCEEGVVVTACTLETEPNDGIDSADPIGSVPESVCYSGAIDPAGDADHVQFEVTQAATVVIETSGLSGDSVIHLYDAAGDELASNDDGGDGAWSRIERLLGTGTYYVKVREYGNDGSIPAYLLTVAGDIATTCTVSGRVVNAETGEAIPDVVVTSIPAERTTTSRADGLFSFSDSPAGTQTISVDSPPSGFLSSSVEVSCEAGVAVEIVIALPAIGEWAVVLTWSGNPCDLDLHVWCPDEHIWYQKTTGGSADLDIDDMDGWGPETFTIRELVDGTYTVAVKHYSCEGTLRSSGAQVQVFSPTERERAFADPSCSTGVGTWWVVARLHVSGGSVQIEAIDQCLEYFDESRDFPPSH